MPIALHRCPAPGCVEMTTAGYCPDHRSNHERVRGNPSQRGYDHRYRKARDEAVERATRCWKCGEPFTADNPPTGGHVVDVRAGGTTADGIRAECQQCNYGRHKAPGTPGG